MQSMKVIRTIAILGTAAFLLLCAKRKDSATIGAAPSSYFRTIDPLPGRVFEIRADPEAARLLDDVFKEPFDKKRRLTLASHYAATGFDAMAAFFKETSSPLRERIVPVAQYAQWGCHDTGPPPLETENRLQALMYAYDAAAALALARDAFEKQPSSCDVQMDFAGAVVFAEELQSGAVKPEEREMAIRALLTAATDTGWVAPAYVTAEEMYRRVGHVFANYGDHQSEYYCYKLAEVEIATTPASGLPAGGLDASKRLLREDIERVEAQLR